MNTESQTRAGERTQRIAELEGDINAHRQGWTTWDKASLEEMKAELRTLRELAKLDLQTSGWTQISADEAKRIHGN